jgi:hypothetical protein
MPRLTVPLTAAPAEGGRHKERRIRLIWLVDPKTTHPPAEGALGAGTAWVYELAVRIEIAEQGSDRDQVRVAEPGHELGCVAVRVGQDQREAGLVAHGPGFDAGIGLGFASSTPARW